MAKITIPNILGMFLSVTGINNRLTQVEEEFNDKVLYRNNPGSEPNQMDNDLDMNSNDILNVKSITFIGGNSLVQNIESGSPNIEVTDDGQGNYTISGVSLGGGDVFRAFDNEYLPGTVQKMPKLEILGVDIGEELIAQSIIQSALAQDVATLTTQVTNAVNTAGIALTTAQSAQTTANSANTTANAAETKANQNAVTIATKISQAQGDARYLKPFSSTRKDFVNFQIRANGSSLGAPTGWTTSEQDDGRYRVVHNTSQSVFPVVTVVNDANNAPQKTASIVYVSNNAFDITIEDTPDDKLLNVMLTY
jgi:hypothetical protein